MLLEARIENLEDMHEQLSNDALHIMQLQKELFDTKLRTLEREHKARLDTHTKIHNALLKTVEVMAEEIHNLKQKEEAT